MTELKKYPPLKQNVYTLFTSNPMSDEQTIRPYDICIWLNEYCICLSGSAPAES